MRIVQGQHGLFQRKTVIVVGKMCLFLWTADIFLSKTGIFLERIVIFLRRMAGRLRKGRVLSGWMAGESPV
jgi:hypothetical protein